MAFLAALPEIAEAGAAGGAEAGAAGGAEAGAGGGKSGLMDLFKSKPRPLPGDSNKQQNVGESRTFNFMSAVNSARSALRGGVD